MCCRALCLLHCSDVLCDSHSKACTRCPENLAKPGDEECSCTAGTAHHHLSCGTLAGGTSRTVCAAVPRGAAPAWVCHGPPSQKCHECVLVMGAAAKGSQGSGLCQKHLEQEHSLVLLPTSECRVGGWEPWGSACSLGPLTLLKWESTLGYGNGNIKPLTADRVALSLKISYIFLLNAWWRWSVSVGVACGDCGSLRLSSKHQWQEE